MPPKQMCAEVRLALSVARDEGQPLRVEMASHLAGCDNCAGFAEHLNQLEDLLAADRFDQTPDIAGRVMRKIGRSSPSWWVAAAVVLIGLTVGALIGGVGTRLDRVRASDLSEVFHRASPSVEGFTADVVVVERGWHPDVPERHYTGKVAFAAPESLSLRLDDLTKYPGPDWLANNIEIVVDGGDYVSSAPSGCPVAALPGCQQPPSTVAFADRRPFVDSRVSPLAFTGSGQGTSPWGGTEVLGYPSLGGRETIQLETTVGGVETISMLTGVGAWRELHPTDRTLLWLEETSLIPLRIEVFAGDSPERRLWALRRGYEDSSDEPIFILELTNLRDDVPDIDLNTPEGALSAGFVESTVEVPVPSLPDGFVEHRTGYWTLPEGAPVETASWSDGRSWLMIETTTGWSEPRLFGLTTSFVREIELGDDSTGYLDPFGRSIAIHSEIAEILVSGSVAQSTLIEVARSLEVDGIPVPDHWDQSTILDMSELTAETLVPSVEGWEILSEHTGDTVKLLMVGGGNRSVLIEQLPGERLAPPRGPDTRAVEVRGITGRIDSGTGVLQWLEDDTVIRLRSDSVGSNELISIANSLERR